MSLGFPAEEMGMQMQVFYGDERGHLEGGAVKESGVQGNRGSRMDDPRQMSGLLFIRGHSAFS